MDENNVTKKPLFWNCNLKRGYSHDNHGALWPSISNIRYEVQIVQVEQSGSKALGLTSHCSITACPTNQSDVRYFFNLWLLKLGKDNLAFEKKSCKITLCGITTIQHIKNPKVCTGERKSSLIKMKVLHKLKLHRLCTSRLGKVE